MLAGVRALVVALVANATWSFGRASVKQISDGAIALATALLFFVGLSPSIREDPSQRANAPSQ